MRYRFTFEVDGDMFLSGSSIGGESMPLYRFEELKHDLRKNNWIILSSKLERIEMVESVEVLRQTP